MGSCGSHDDNRGEDNINSAYKPSSAQEQALRDEDKATTPTPGLGRRADEAVENRALHQGAILGIARCGRQCGLLVGRTHTCLYLDKITTEPVDCIV